MRVPNWLALIGAIVLCLGMVGATHEDYIKGMVAYTILDGMLSFVWLAFVISLIRRTWRHPRGVFARLWK